MRPCDRSLHLVQDTCRHSLRETSSHQQSAVHLVSLSRCTQAACFGLFVPCSLQGCNLSYVVCNWCYILSKNPHFCSIIDRVALFWVSMFSFVYWHCGSLTLNTSYCRQRVGVSLFQPTDFSFIIFSHPPEELEPEVQRRVKAIEDEVKRRRAEVARKFRLKPIHKQSEDLNRGDRKV